MRIENCVIITSKDSRIEMTADELRHFFAGNRIVYQEPGADVSPSPASRVPAPSGDQDAAGAEPGRAS